MCLMTVVIHDITSFLEWQHQRNESNTFCVRTLLYQFETSTKQEAINQANIYAACIRSGICIHLAKSVFDHHKEIALRTGYVP